MSDSRTPTCPVCGLAETGDEGALCADCEATRRDQIADATVLVVDGSWSPEHPRVGGAGIVLVSGGPKGTVTGQQFCGFFCHGSQDAEYQAIVRAHRLAFGFPDVLIFSDAKFVVRRLQGKRKTQLNIGRQVRYLGRAVQLRAEAYQLAHRLSVQGRHAAVNRISTTPHQALPDR